MAKHNPTTKSASFNMRISPKLLDAVTRKAQKEERSIAWMVTHYIEQGLKNDKVRV